MCFKISQLRKGVTLWPNIHCMQKTMLYIQIGKRSLNL
uniref:Uncharacterized protein n=1 Tax=Romanomermis culicivorax TaxID=13658 RepID=A0A915KQ04_ROMCU